MIPLAVAAKAVGLLIESGPALIRTVGGLVGGKTAETANKAADILDVVSDQSPEKKKTALLNALSPDDLAHLGDIQVRLEQIRADRAKTQLEAETKDFSQLQETARAELASDDPFVRETRPLLARQSYKIGAVYAMAPQVIYYSGEALSKISATLTDAAPLPPGNAQESPAFTPDPFILFLLLSPALAFIGLRSLVDKALRAGAAPRLAALAALLPGQKKAP